MLTLEQIKNLKPMTVLQILHSVDGQPLDNGGIVLRVHENYAGPGLVVHLIQDDLGVSTRRVQDLQLNWSVVDALSHDAHVTFEAVARTVRAMSAREQEELSEEYNVGADSFEPALSMNWAEERKTPVWDQCSQGGTISGKDQDED